MFVHTVIMVIEPHMKQGRQHKLISTIFLATSVTKKLDHNREKQLQSELKRLTRSERTHRLCTRAGMLETFLKEPTLLTDDDVMELLTFLFHSEAAQKKLDMLIEERKKTLAIGGS